MLKTEVGRERGNMVPTTQPNHSKYCYSAYTVLGNSEETLSLPLTEALSWHFPIIVLLQERLGLLHEATAIQYILYLYLF